MLISTAYAQSAGGSTEQQLMGFLPIILMFIVLWFLMIRPQMKKAKEHQKMVSELVKGDEVVTSGGLMGQVSKLSDSTVHLEVADNTEVQVQRAAVTLVLPKGTLK
jgi:preprotein translocase subunit YajC